MLQDLYVYDLATTAAWSALSSAAAYSRATPSTRRLHGFASSGGRLYVHGGMYTDGEDFGAVYCFGRGEGGALCLSARPSAGNICYLRGIRELEVARVADLTRVIAVFY